MELDYETQLSVPFGAGSLLVLRAPIRPITDYDGSFEIHDVTIYIVYEDGLSKIRRQLNTIEDIFCLAKELVIELNAALLCREGDYATIFMWLLFGKGRVVNSSPLFSFLENKYGIAQIDNLPRLEDDNFYFLVVGARVDIPDAPLHSVILWSIEINLKARSWRVTEVPRLRP